MKRFAIVIAAFAAFFNIAQAQNVTIVDKPVQTSAIVTSDSFVEDSAPAWRVSLQAGASYAPGKIEESDPGMYDYYKGLKWGFNYGVDVTYFPTRSWGVGVKLNDARFSNSATGTVSYESGETRSGTIADVINVYYAGPTATWRWISNDNKYSLLFSYSIGYMGYYDNSKVIVPVDVKGGSLGTGLGLNFDYALSKNIALGLGVDVMSGSLRSYKVTMSGVTETINLDPGTSLGMSHLDLTAGLRFLL
ncbi:MAG: hypothetical protein J5693_04470 [Bacteroidales bacterium]|nr:hypothetical protein [Bacteroidales bacterium]